MYYTNSNVCEQNVEVIHSQTDWCLLLTTLEIRVIISGSSKLKSGNRNIENTSRLVIHHPTMKASLWRLFCCNLSQYQTSFKKTCRDKKTINLNYFSMFLWNPEPMWKAVSVAEAIVATTIHSPVAVFPVGDWWLVPSRVKVTRPSSVGE